MLLKMRREAKHPLLVGTVILVFLSIFTKSYSSSPFDAMKAVVVMSYSACHFVYNGYDVVNCSGCDLRDTVGVISSIQWM